MEKKVPLLMEQWRYLKTVFPIDFSLLLTAAKLHLHLQWSKNKTIIMLLEHLTWLFDLENVEDYHLALIWLFWIIVTIIISLIHPKSFWCPKHQLFFYGFPQGQKIPLHVLLNHFIFSVQCTAWPHPLPHTHTPLYTHTILNNKNK